jgi:hypothetical protein
MDQKTPSVLFTFVILSGPRPVFVNLNSQLFLEPNPTYPKSQTVCSKETFGKVLSVPFYIDTRADSTFPSLPSTDQVAACQ